MSIKIESGIPAPTGRAGYPFSQMAVGDSFFVECDTFDEAKKTVTSVGASARNYGKKHEGTKFATRTIVDAHEAIEGVRCWRTE